MHDDYKNEINSDFADIHVKREVITNDNLSNQRIQHQCSHRWPINRPMPMIFQPMVSSADADGISKSSADDFDLQIGQVRQIFTKNQDNGTTFYLIDNVYVDDFLQKKFSLPYV